MKKYFLALLSKIILAIRDNFPYFLFFLRFLILKTAQEIPMGCAADRSDELKKGGEPHTVFTQTPAQHVCRTHGRLFQAF